MSALIDKIKSISKIQLLAIVLIIAGVGIMVSKVLGLFSFFKEVRYSQVNNFKAGNLSPDLLRPWMTIQYVSISFAVPQKYILDAVKIQPKKENSMIALNRLNKQMNLGTTNSKPDVLGLVADAIIQYRKNPVATGLIEGHVTDVMSIQYIANSIGIPSQTIFADLGIPMDGNAYLPLGVLSDTVKYSGGPKSLTAAVQKIVDQTSKKP